ncbi:MAG: cysteine synthase A [Campylobacterales bacterium]|nr:cysteine synthase A [Campylobacterales bacterium]
MIANSIVDLVGNTPLIKLNKLSLQSGANIYGKCEFMNPTSSVKDRIALNMINQAINRGEINEKTTIIEPTSGNTGVGLAAVCAAKGIKLIITMPDSMSLERRNILTHLGAKLFLTPAAQGMKGSIDKAMELNSTIENSIVLQQFQNPDNPAIHRTTTAQEIYNDLGDSIDYFIAGVGTGGTLTGVGEVLKSKISTLQVIAVEPNDSAVLSGEEARPHKIQGIGAGFIPQTLNITVYDNIQRISNEDAYNMSRDAAKSEGLLVGISSGANLQAAYNIASKPENRGKTIVTILCDTAERYLSTELFKSQML